MLNLIPRQKSVLATAHQSSLPSCRWKTHISPCQGFNIVTSFYLLVLFSNSKPNYHRYPHISQQPWQSFSRPLYFTSNIHIKWCGILCLQKATHWKPGCGTPDFSFKGKKTKARGPEAIFAFCCSSRFESSLVWLIFPPVLQSSLVIPLQHFGLSPQKWQMCSHGNRPVTPLSPLPCQMKPSSAREEPAGDLTDLTSVQQGDFSQPSCF